MPDETQSGMTLPPKLSARREFVSQQKASADIRDEQPPPTVPPAEVPVAAPSVAAPAGAGDAVRIQSSAPEQSVRPTVVVPVVSAAPAASGPGKEELIKAAAPAIGVPLADAKAPKSGSKPSVPVAPLVRTKSPAPTTFVSAKPDRKKETSRLALEDARPAPLEASAIQTVRMKKAPEQSAVIKIPPKTEDQKKSDTSRLALENVITAGPAQSPQDVRTIKMQKKTVAAAIPAPVVSARKPDVPPPAAADASPSAGPVTIKLKRPDGAARSDFAAVASSTARIAVEPFAQPSPAAVVTPAPSVDVRTADAHTIKIKRPGELPGVPQAAEGHGPRTIKIARPTPALSGKPSISGDMPAQTGSDAASETDMGDAVSAPLTQKRTISLKKQEGGSASERSQRMAEEEAKLGIQRPQASEQEGAEVAVAPARERFLWIWCLVSFAAIVVISLVIWVVCVHVYPTSSNFNWSGRMVPYNSQFYKGERALL